MLLFMIHRKKVQAAGGRRAGSSSSLSSYTGQLNQTENGFSLECRGLFFLAHSFAGSIYRTTSSVSFTLQIGRLSRDLFQRSRDDMINNIILQRNRGGGREDPLVPAPSYRHPRTTATVS